MAEQCKSCGAELFAGQQFCRFCGAATVALHGGDLPTQILPAEKSAGTADTGGARHAPSTDPFFPASPTNNYYQPPAVAPPVAQTSALGRRRSPRRWIVAFLALGFVGTLMLAALLVGLSMRHETGRTETRVVKPVVRKMQKMEGMPPMPPMAPGMTGTESGDMLDETGADVSSDATTITKSYALKEGATLALRNMRGDIKIEGWEGANAEVKIVKRGGSDDERRRARITTSNEKNQLSLATLPSTMAHDVEVDYEIKLPRNVKHLEINSLMSDVEVSNVEGSVALNIQTGDINLENVGGVVRTQLVKGATKISLSDKARAGREPYNIGAVNGDVELSIGDGIDADIKAEVVSGDIEADDDFNFKVTERPIGKHLVGRTGAGGKPIVVKVVNGEIKIKN